MSEAIILPPTTPELLGLVVVSDERMQAIQEFGTLVSCLVKDPAAINNDFEGHVIRRTLTSSDDTSTTLETRIDRKRILVKPIDWKTAETIKGEMNLEFKRSILADPTLNSVDFMNIKLQVINPDVEMSITIAKSQLRVVDLDDPFIKEVLDYFRRHIKARNCRSLDN